MKKLLSILTILVLSACVFAQDIIVTNKAQKIDAEILEVSTSEVRYKELDNLNGPTFMLRADEINCIIYANGKVVLYSQSQESNSVEERKTAEAIAKANAMESLFGNEDTGVKGNPVGHGYKEVASWSLSGRGIKGTLPKPANTFNQEGRVIVEIRVNAKGDVISATPKSGTVTDKKTIQMALDAARKAKFTEGDHEQIGTITYNFKFN